MSEHLDYDSLRADTVRQVAKLMAASAAVSSGYRSRSAEAL